LIKGKSWPTKLTGASLDDADLSAATFRGTGFAGVSFKGAKLTKTRFENCQIDEELLRLFDDQGAVVESGAAKS
jgi:uncharacterized protein YjbI with pentapeptide repeats